MANAATKPFFTAADANKILPLVRSIVTDVVTEFARMRDAGRERRALEVESAGSAETRALVDSLKGEVNERSVRIDGYLRELQDLGVDVKDLERGLVDFPSQRGGRPVFLCWELGETNVTHWHGVEETYVDRRPVAESRAARANPSANPAERPDAGDAPA
jgi:hypothetical protein